MSVLKQKTLVAENNINHFSRERALTPKRIKRANDPISHGLRLCLLGTLGFLLVCFTIAPLSTLLKATALIAWLSVFIGVIRLAACLQPKPQPFQYLSEASEISDKNYPVYTVLVPLFHEANIVANLMKNLERLDYPKEKLEIFLICEALDPITISAVKRRIRAPFKLIVVPRGTPQTKPRALNYAMNFAQGDYITIYDAEDRPHPQQLKTALEAFKAHPEWGALQAPLDYYNISESFITRQFALEYAALFHVRLPYLGAWEAPFPLGGTSNHMRGLM